MKIVTVCKYTRTKFLVFECWYFVFFGIINTEVNDLVSVSLF